MKYFAILLCFYFNALTILPSVKVIKSHFAERCQSACNKNASENQENDGCQKEKCLLNFSYSSSVFVVFTSNYEFKNNQIFIPKKDNILYHKKLISKYNVTIWQPPESFLFS